MFLNYFSNGIKMKIFSFISILLHSCYLHCIQPSKRRHFTSRTPGLNISPINRWLRMKIFLSCLNNQPFFATEHKVWCARWNHENYFVHTLCFAVRSENIAYDYHHNDTVCKFMPESRPTWHSVKYLHSFFITKNGGKMESCVWPEPWLRLRPPCPASTPPSPARPHSSCSAPLSLWSSFL